MGWLGWYKTTNGLGKEWWSFWSMIILYSYILLLHDKHIKSSGKHDNTCYSMALAFILGRVLRSLKDCRHHIIHDICWRPDSFLCTLPLKFCPIYDSMSLNSYIYHSLSYFLFLLPTYIVIYRKYMFANNKKLLLL